MQMTLRNQLSTMKFHLLMKYYWLRGKNHQINSEDRKILEEVIIPYYCDRSDIQKVLFVGCAPYTSHYSDLWAGKEYWTIDIDPHQERFGSENHVVGSLENLDDYFPEATFDLIICNGVYGFGLNDREGCERAFLECFQALRDGGEFILGWNQVPQYNPLDLEEIQALQLFHPKAFPPLGDWRYVCKGGILHTYDFFARPTTTSS
jgi:SAM-dependent methyltransferase